jgi:hypothetical protein
MTQFAAALASCSDRHRSRRQNSTCQVPLALTRNTGLTGVGYSNANPFTLSVVAHYYG